ncbi:ubiquitin-protein ligase peroxin 12 [Ceratobasidium sp. 395]|nr:ubiquitin-protein ligase peroxin 12 [Ceratobasidium sp. 395]
MSAQAGQDLAPLTLACQHGHKDIVLLLLAHGAVSQPNSNGELPLHLAAREGHAEICALLLSGVLQDIPDKYNEWTPLFHAARYGNTECVQLLLEAGHNPTATDDVGRQPVHYAAWFGHMDCVQTLVQAIQLPRGRPPTAKKTVSISPASDLDAPLDFDLDAEPIPTLSLPPPIMPFRVYGHNYLDQNHLVQIALGCPWWSHDNKVLRPVAGVQLIPRLQGLSSKALPQSNPSLKLVAASNFSITDPSFNVVLPLSDDQEMFSFQVQELDNLTLEFSVYPSFGSKAIGRAVALSHSFSELQGTGKIILPILDHRLHLIGQVAFDVCIITPFSSVGFDVGAKFQTYWKSSTVPLNANTALPTRQHAPRLGGPSSVHASPALNVTGVSAGGGTVMTSSLTGEFVHLVIQVTRDLVPVVYARRFLPVSGFDLHMGAVTYEQFRRLGQDTMKGQSFSTAAEWQADPVFFSSYCGIVPRESHDAEASIETAVGDLRQSSISGAVDFAKENNLLGILVDARLIHQVPSVVLAVRDANILLGSFGSPDQVSSSSPVSPDMEPLNLDATLTQGVLTVHEHFSSVQQL